MRLAVPDPGPRPHPGRPGSWRPCGWMPSGGRPGNPALRGGKGTVLRSRRSPGEGRALLLCAGRAQNGCSRSSQQGWGSKPRSLPGAHRLWERRARHANSGGAAATGYLVSFRQEPRGRRQEGCCSSGTSEAEPPDRHWGGRERGKQGRHAEGGSRAWSPMCQRRQTCPQQAPGLILLEFGLSRPRNEWESPFSPAFDLRMGAPARGAGGRVWVHYSVGSPGPRPSPVPGPSVLVPMATSSQPALGCPSV